MIFQELNRTQCKAYLLGCERTRKAVLVDPCQEMVARYLAVLAYHGLRLDAVIDTHTHADHRTGCFLLNDLIGARVIMHRRAPAPRVTQHVEQEDVIGAGELALKVYHTPGHTPDSISLHIENLLFTGDVMLIGGTGRTDFAGGDSGEQYDSITGSLFRLPDKTRVFPSHDYRGNTESTIGYEKLHNPRIAGRSRQEYIDLMASIEFPLPDKIQEVLQPNQSAIDDDKMSFPTLVQLNEVRQLRPDELHGMIKLGQAPLLLDVREQEELGGELGHIVGSHHIPLQELASRVDELREHQDAEIVCLCRAGMRSTTAAAILTGLGFNHVSNLRGGMVDWNDRGYSVER
ncbi:MAG: MBL fold metallo-hydrolase [Gammaproteobacteria bacterium]|nr:MBL fold metallo-hydrolase [Gammaproteobacteria bacterium]